jgi:DNA-binding NtrC family response regulator
MVVDDCFITTEIINTLIHKRFPNEFNVIIANTIEDAIDILDTKNISLVFQDLHVGNLSAGIISANYAKRKNIPVCIITADYDLNTLTMASKYKYDKFIMKPITETDIARSIKDLVF